jgi:hypothetical protein
MRLKTQEVRESVLRASVAYHGALRSATLTQGLGNRLIIEDESGVGSTGAIQFRQRLGGMLNYYDREAARGRSKQAPMG